MRCKDENKVSNEIKLAIAQAAMITETGCEVKTAYIVLFSFFESNRIQ